MERNLTSSKISPFKPTLFCLKRIGPGLPNFINRATGRQIRRKGIKRVLLGSVAENVVRNAECTVLVAR